MVSEAKGHLVIPCWSDDGNLTPLSDNEGFLYVTEQSPLEYVQARQHGYIGTSWIAQPLVFSYSDRLAEFVTFTVVSAGSQLRTLLIVPENYVYVITATMSINRTKDVVQNHLLYDNANYFLIKAFSAPGATVWVVNDNINYALKYQDRVTFQFISCDINDELEFCCWGYKMRVG